MSARVSVFVSHTTRDPRDASLARHLANELASRGAETWIAPVNIPSGAEWKNEIVAAIMERCTHFLVLVSAASAAAGWVQQEIQLAAERRRRDPSFVLLSLTIGRVDDFAGRAELARYQDVPYLEDPTAQARELARALGLRPPMPRRFEGLIHEKTQGFVGRDHVFAQIERFLQQNDRGYLTIEGDPGIGKSAILAELVRRTDCLAHFNVRAQGANTAAEFLESICTQLIARYRLDHPGLPDNATRSGAVLGQLLEEASGRIAPGDRLLIVVDALDEVEQSRDQIEHGANVLFLPATLPAGVYFVLSRRQMEIRLVSSAPIDVVDLMRYPDENRLDIVAYLRDALRREGLQRWVNGAGISAEAFVERMTDKSERNFMYLRYILRDLERGLYGDFAVDSLPAGLQAYYEDHWRRMGMMTRPLPRAKIKIVYILAEVRQPISNELLSRLSNEDALTVQEVLDDWDQFLHEDRRAGPTRYSIYHASFRDFLHRKDVVQAAALSIEGVNAAIATALWEDVFAESPPPPRTAT